MALRAGYYGVKRRIWEALQSAVATNTTDITALETSLETATILYEAPSLHSKIASVSVGKLRKSGNVIEASFDFTVGDSNISSWTDDLIVFDVPYASGNFVTVIRDLTDATDNDIQTVLLKPSGSKIGFTSSKVFTAAHRYTLSFTYILYPPVSASLSLSDDNRSIDPEISDVEPVTVKKSTRKKSNKTEED